MKKLAINAPAMTMTARIAILTGVTIPVGFCGPFLSTRSIIFISLVFHGVGRGARGWLNGAAGESEMRRNVATAIVIRVICIRRAALCVIYYRWQFGERWGFIA